MTTSEEQLEFAERNTHYGTGAAILDLSIPHPLDVFLDQSSQSSFSPNTLGLVQKILFLPRFSTTEHLFHGQNLDSLNPSFGLPSGREASITGENFSLFIRLNLGTQLRDQSEPLTRVRLDSRHRRRPYWWFNAHDGMIPQAAEGWLTDEVLSPILNELIITDPPGQSAVERMARMGLVRSE